MPAGITKVSRPGKFQFKKNGGFKMDMPDEKQSGIYGLKRNDDDEIVDSLVDDTSQ